ncbi:hypothetical protein SHL15_6291 [Streptomyces hygroscopicus subsp. limoneus]|nr:hypothetical protein SHL15_6291 [Streptomyces hygroscopicus subsp. limoneus]
MRSLTRRSSSPRARPRSPSGPHPVRGGGPGRGSPAGGPALTVRARNRADRRGARTRHRAPVRRCLSRRDRPARRCGATAPGGPASPVRRGRGPASAATRRRGAVTSAHHVPTPRPSALRPCARTASCRRPPHRVADASGTGAGRSVRACPVNRRGRNRCRRARRRGLRRPRTSAAGGAARGDLQGHDVEAVRGASRWDFSTRRHNDRTAPPRPAGPVPGTPESPRGLCEGGRADRRARTPR